jgi:hypothetical protein
MFLRKDLFRLKVKASMEYHHFLILKKELDEVNNKLKALIARKEDSMESFAINNGIISKKSERLLTEGLV